MADRPTDHLLYAYAVVPSSLSMARAPAGLDEERVRLVADGELGALVSSLDAAAYDRERIESSIGEVGWVGPRASAHDVVVTWASDAGPVVPLPMFTLYRDESNVHTMLQERSAELRATLANVARGREYGVRVFRVDETLQARVSALSPRLAELERAAAAATPGQRYLLERKVEGERREEARRIATQVSREVYAALAELSAAAVHEPIPPREAGDVAGVAVLNAYFLVAPRSLDEFRRTLTELTRRHEPNGFGFQFTGPWPPYHFVTSSNE